MITIWDLGKQYVLILVMYVVERLRGRGGSTYVHIGPATSQVILVCKIPRLVPDRRRIVWAVWGPTHISYRFSFPRTPLHLSYSQFYSNHQLFPLTSDELLSLLFAPDGKIAQLCAPPLSPFFRLGHSMIQPTVFRRSQ